MCSPVMMVGFMMSNEIENDSLAHAVSERPNWTNERDGGGKSEGAGERSL